MPVQKIDRIPLPEAETSFRDYVVRRKPVIITIGNRGNKPPWTQRHQVKIRSCRVELNPEVRAGEDTRRFAHDDAPRGRDFLER